MWHARVSAREEKNQQDTLHAADNSETTRLVFETDMDDHLLLPV